ncbi:hypothetical protein JCM8097_008151 [Rhodosporidiobolus ruineniae]
MLVPLSIIDSNVQDPTMLLAYVVGIGETWSEREKEEFGERVREAAERVVGNWRLLQGTAKKLEDGSWAVAVPDEGEPSKPNHFGFVYEAVDKPYHVVSGTSSPLPPLSSASSGFFPLPNLSLFRSAGTAVTLPDYERQQAPFLHLKITALTDVFAIGLSLPHGIFDGHGMGLVAQALDAELHHKPWPFSLPPLTSVERGNPMVNALDAPVEDPNVEAVEVGPPPSNGWRSAVESKLRACVGSAGLLRSYCKSETWFGFLRREVVEKLVGEVKKEVQTRTEGTEYVSTSDVLSAFLLKSAHRYEATSATTTLKLITVFNGRTLLDSYQSSSSSSTTYPFSAYPHNCIFPYDLNSPRPLDLAQLHSMPLADLALLLRRGLDAHRTLPALKTAWDTRYKPATGQMAWIGEWSFAWPELPPVLPSLFGLSLPPLRYAISSQLGLKLAALSFPGRDGKDLPLLAFHVAGDSPFPLMNCFLPQDVEAGVTFTASLHPSRWECLEKAIEELEGKAEDGVC